MNPLGPVAKLLAPDKGPGRALLALRAKVELLSWRPKNGRDQSIKSVLQKIMPRYTMVGLVRLRKLVSHIDQLHHDRIPGAVVECGTWRGGTLAFLDWSFRQLGEQRELWAFDSFQGLPKPGPLDPASAHIGFFDGWCYASEADLRDAIKTLGGAPEQVHVVKGWLSDTLPTAQTGPIALLNIDVDWYDSVTTVLEHLIPHMSSRGIVNIDDFGRWSGCDRAVFDYLDRRGWSHDIIQRTGKHGAWFRIE